MRVVAVVVADGDESRARVLAMSSLKRSAALSK